MIYKLIENQLVKYKFSHQYHVEHNSIRGMTKQQIDEMVKSNMVKV